MTVSHLDIITIFYVYRYWKFRMNCAKCCKIIISSMDWLHMRTINTNDKIWNGKEILSLQWSKWKLGYQECTLYSNRRLLQDVSLKGMFPDKRLRRGFTLKYQTFCCYSSLHPGLSSWLAGILRMPDHQLLNPGWFWILWWIWQI